jgi:hypothetical protein
MKSDSSVQQTGAVRVRLAMPLMQLSDVASAAESAVDAALEFCAQKMTAGNQQSIISRIQEGDAVTCSYWSYGLGQHVAKQLGSMDADIKCLYLYDYDATAEDVVFGEKRSLTPVHMIAWVQPKTAALNSLVEVIDRSLVEACHTRLGLPKLGHMIDIQMVDDVEVEQRLGYGAMIMSVHRAPIKIWAR